MGHILLSKNTINIQSIYESVKAPECGAIVIFIGTVRNQGIYEGKIEEIDSMYVEGYEDMTINKLNVIATEVKQKYGIHDISIVHRIGQINAGEVIVAIAVSSKHRKEAFNAAKYAIDRLKEIVPLWKKEIFTGGNEKWVGID